MGPFRRTWGRMKTLLLGVPHHWFGSIDVSYKCNLRCSHCYFFALETVKNEMSVEGWVAKLDALKAQGFPFVQCSWIGGEPLLRPEVIEAGKRYFKSNLVVTNATMPLPDWPDVTFYVSIDGTKSFHEKIRGEDTFELTKANACRPDLTVYVCCVITKENHVCLEEMVEEWSGLPIQGMVFDFYTPTEGADDSAWLPPELRDQVIDRLLKLKERVGSFIAPPAEVYEAMYSHHSRTVTDNCPYSAKSFAFDATGAPKGKCMMGEEADCDRCGCVVPYFLWAMHDKPTLAKMLWRSTKGTLSRYLGLGGNNSGSQGLAPDGADGRGSEGLIRKIAVVKHED